MKYPAILLLISGLGACAAPPSEPDRQADLNARYVYTLERQARQGFKSIYWVTPPTNAQVERRLGAQNQED